MSIVSALTVSPASTADASLLKIADSSTSANTDSFLSGNFLSLLNIGLNPSQNSSASENNDPAPAPDNNNNNNEQNAPSAPVPQASHPQPENNSNQDVTSSPQNAPDNTSANNAAPQTPQPPQNDAEKTASNNNNNSANNNASTPAQQPQSPQNSASNAATPAQNNSANSNASANNPANPPAKKLRADIQNQLGNIDQILLAIIQNLSAAPATALATTPATASAATAAATTPALPALTLPAALPTTPTTQGQTAATAQPASAAEIALLKDIQSVLQQMQQTLQPGETAATSTSSTAAATTAAPQDTTNDKLNALTDALQKDVAQLAQFLTPQTGTPAAKTAQPSVTPLVQTSATTAPTTTNTTPAPTDIASLLKAGIADARAQLQQLKTANDANFAQTKSDLQSQFASAKQLFSDAANATPSPASALQNAQTSAAAPAAAQTSQMQNLAALNQVIPATQLISLTAQDIAPVSQTGSNNSGDSNGGNGNQGQAAAQPVASAAPGQTQTVSSGGTPSFARMLNQASPAPVLDQVLVQMKTAIGDGSSKIRIQLDPAELGKVEIKLSVGADGKTSVTVTADNHNTLTLLQRDSQGLTQALNDAGLSTDSSSLNFNLRGGQQEQRQGGNNAQASSTYQKTQPDEEDDMSIAAVSSNYVVNMSQGLDIKI